MAQPMNASSSHPKVKVSLTLGKAIYVAGGNVTGKLQMECRADQGLGISAMRVELFAIQELTSRDHTTRSVFLHTEQLYQGPGLPPSNAVQPHPMPGDPPLPQHYNQARRGISTFLVRFPLPATSPSSINFGNNLAKVRYELRAGVQVYWKGEKRLVTDVKEINVVESYVEEEEPVGQVVGENGKIWIQGRVIGGVVVVGETACVELQVKNHSSKQNNGLSISLTRQLNLPGSSQKSPILISDTITTVPFRGPEYIIPPGAEGVASLVFDVPRHARGSRGGLLEGDRTSKEPKESLFEVQCFISIRMSMGLTSKDLTLDLPVHLIHPNALPPPAEIPLYGYSDPQTQYPLMSPMASPPPMPYMSPPLTMSPGPVPYVDSNYVWFPPPHAYQYPQYTGTPVYLPPPVQDTPPRPTSAGGHDRSMLPLDNPGAVANVDVVPEEGKGERASRITQHLRLSSRTRSVSPQSHRYPMPQILAKREMPIPPPITLPSPTFSERQQSPVLHSPRPVLTPKQSFTEHIDMLTSRSLPKSERVEDLERMADEVAKKKKDLSNDIPPSTILSTKPRTTEVDNVAIKPAKTDVDINKTLPGPPKPSRKISASLLAARPIAQDYFTSTTPPTPTLAATRTKSKMSNAGENHKIQSVRNAATLVPDLAESGLDALERKLLAQVGTQKVEENVGKPDVRTVLPIAIPPKSADPDESLNDSAISSLSLTEALDKQDQDDRDADSDGKTHKGKSSTVNDEKTGRSDGEKRLHKKKSKEGDARKMRKAAKGKVAAWLNAVEPDMPTVAPEVPSASPAASIPDIEPLPEPEEPTMQELLASQPPDTADPPPIPNARSSGFVPIGSLRRDALGRSLVPVNSAPAEESKHVADLWSSPPSSAPGDSSSHGTYTNPWNTSKALSKKKFNLPAFPPPRPDSEVKYDYRSARGGRGGQVTAVASLWAKSQNPQAESALNSQPGRLPKIHEKKKLVSGTTTPTTPALRPPPPLKKSMNPPALVSSSHAKPTISSTASLARPISLKHVSAAASKDSPTVSELPVPESTRVKYSSTKPPTIERGAKRGTSAAIEGLTRLNNSSTGSNAKPEMAFGQARLRDLIRKYQGGGNSG